MATHQLQTISNCSNHFQTTIVLSLLALNSHIVFVMVNPYNYLPPYVLSVMVFVGTYCLILAYQKAYEIEGVLKNGIRTTGTVIEIRQDPSGSGGEAPVVDFNYPNGSHRHYSTTYTYPSPYRVGQQVDIWYKFYKSNQVVALADDKPGNLPKYLFWTGIVLCILSYPEVIRRMMTLV